MFKKLLLGLSLISPFSVLAHPHAFIDMQTKPLVKDNQLIGFSTQWLLDEASSSAVLYDMMQTKGDKAAKQKLIDEVMANVVNEHYFSYVFDKENHKINIKNSLKIMAHVLKEMRWNIILIFFWHNLRLCKITNLR